MTSYNHAKHAARTAAQSSMEVLTAAEADAIVGGGLFDTIGNFVDHVGDALGDAYNYGKRIFNAVRGVFHRRFSHSPHSHGSN
jgi:hypothetical protein